MRYPGFDNSYMFSLLIYFSIYLPYVLGHSFVREVDVGGRTYPAWNPNFDPYVRSLAA